MKLPSPIHKSDLKKTKCLWAADQFFNQGVEEVDSPIAEDGSWDHELIQIPYEGLATEDQVISCCETEEEQEILINAWENDPYKDEPGFIELKVAVDENGKWTVDKEKAYFAGMLDRLILPDGKSGSFREKTLIVQDWKTGWLREQDQNEQIAYSVMGAAYAESCGYEVEQVQFIYDFCRFGDRQATLFKVSDLPALWNLLKSRIYALEQMPAIPIPGHHCAYCQFCGGSCPLGMSIEAALPIVGLAEGLPVDRSLFEQALTQFQATGQVSTEMAPFIGFAVAWYDRKASDLKGKLKDYIIDTGQNIPIGDTEWAVAEEDGDRWDHEAAWNILQRAKLPEEALRNTLHITKQTAGKLKKAHPAVYQELMGWARLKREPKRVLRQRKIA